LNVTPVENKERRERLRWQIRRDQVRIAELEKRLARAAEGCSLIERAVSWFLYHVRAGGGVKKKGHSRLPVLDKPRTVILEGLSTMPTWVIEVKLTGPTASPRPGRKNSIGSRPISYTRRRLRH
jgi:hypothetical protein